MKPTDEHERYQQAIKTEFDTLNRQIDELNAKAQQAEGEEKVEYVRAIAVLQAKQEMMQSKLDELQASNDDVWDDLKSGLELVWNDLQSTFSTIVEEFEAGRQSRK